jgi:hypothetical protein
MDELTLLAGREENPSPAGITDAAATAPPYATRSASNFPRVIAKPASAAPKVPPGFTRLKNRVRSTLFSGRTAQKSRPIDPVFRADSVVLAISVVKDGNLRVVYARIGRRQGHPAWRGA